MNDTTWYQHWFGTDYLQLYQYRSGEEAAGMIGWLVGELRLRLPAAVLDLACGSGRHSRELLQYGFKVYGLDLSWTLLGKAQQAGNPNLVRGDMRDLPWREHCFDAVLSLFTSFGYFSSDEGNRAVLSEVTRILRGGGFLVLDFLNAELVRKQIVPSEAAEIDGQQVSILRWLDEPEGRVEKRILIHESNRAIREYRESVRLYSKDELTGMLARAGIRAQATFGDYGGSSFDKDSPRLIIIGRKHA